MRWGFSTYGVWTPTQTIVKTVGSGSSKKRVAQLAPVFPGYAFVPEFNASTVINSCPAHFTANALSVPDGLDFKKHAYCTLSELRRMEECLNHYKEAKEKAPQSVDFVNGDRVLVIASQFSGLEGHVTGSPRNGIVKVKLGKIYIKLPVMYIQHI